MPEAALEGAPEVVPEAVPEVVPEGALEVVPEAAMLATASSGVLESCVMAAISVRFISSSLAHIFLQSLSNALLNFIILHLSS